MKRKRARTEEYEERKKNRIKNDRTKERERETNRHIKETFKIAQKKIRQNKPKKNTPIRK